MFYEFVIVSTCYKSLSLAILYFIKQIMVIMKPYTSSHLGYSLTHRTFSHAACFDVKKPLNSKGLHLTENRLTYLICWIAELCSMILESSMCVLQSQFCHEPHMGKRTRFKYFHIFRKNIMVVKMGLF
jgi:hypothetical protein